MPPAWYAACSGGLGGGAREVLVLARVRARGFVPPAGRRRGVDRLQGLLVAREGTKYPCTRYNHYVWKGTGYRF